VTRWERFRPRLRWLARTLERTLAVVGAVAIVYHLFFEVTVFTTSSMAPLLKGREKGAPDWALIEKLSAGKKPERFQVVSFVNEDGVPVAKRVVAFAGETVEITSRTLVVDGVRMPTPEGVGRGEGWLAAGNLRQKKPFVVPEGSLYVLGDDTQDSYDSRFTGALPLGEVRGRVVLRVWPLARWRWLL